MKNEHCVVVIGGYVNGYSIIQELHEKKVKNIFVMSYGKSVSSYSNKIKEHIMLEKNATSLKSSLKKLHTKYNKIVIYPTHDSDLELLHEIYDEIKDFCFIPFNDENLLEMLQKNIQYEYCEKIGVPYPKSLFLKEESQFEDIYNLTFPILLKPTKSEIQGVKVFRTLELTKVRDLKKEEQRIKRLIENEVEFVVSEIIPGDGSNIYAYVGYRNKKGEILNEWIGKKLTQFPNDFGVFASSSNQAPEIVREQGRRLIDSMNLYGICQPEFKYDYRDGKYKLMEVNLRSMMWHRTGNLSGVNIQYTQYLDAMGRENEIKMQEQITDRSIHFVYLKYEIINLLTRRKYLRYFWKSIFKSEKTHFALLDKKDIQPFIRDYMNIFGGVLKWLKR